MRPEALPGALAISFVACGGGGGEPKHPDPASQPRIACPKAEVFDTITADPSAHHDRHEKLHADAVRQVLDFHFGNQPEDCATARVVATQILRRGRETSDEAWIVESCERECFEYRVSVKPVGRAFGLSIRVPGS